MVQCALGTGAEDQRSRGCAPSGCVPQGPFRSRRRGRTRATNRPTCRVARGSPRIAAPRGKRTTNSEKASFGTAWRAPANTRAFCPRLTFLAAAVVGVPVFRWLGQSAVLGYLVAGVLIGPSGLSLIAEPETPPASPRSAWCCCSSSSGSNCTCRSSSPCGGHLRPRRGAARAVLPRARRRGRLAGQPLGAAAVVGIALALSATAVGAATPEEAGRPRQPLWLARLRGAAVPGSQRRRHPRPDAARRLGRARDGRAVARRGGPLHGRVLAAIAAAVLRGALRPEPVLPPARGRAAPAR